VGKIGNYTIPHSVTTIGNSAFYGCSDLTSVTIGNSVTTIEVNAFTGCSSLTNIDVGVHNSIYSSINGVLFNKLQDALLLYPAGKTEDYAIPNSVTTIGDKAFSGCNGLTSVTIPHSVTTIGEFAFSYCNGLSSLTIESSVTFIKDYAFLGCNGLTEIYVKAQTPPRIVEHTFDNVYKSIPVYVCGSAEDYRKAVYWRDFTNIIQYNNCDVGVANIAGENEIRFYPNPAIDNITITLPENIPHALFTLYDMQGKMLIRKEVSNQDAISVSNLASGIYIYNVRTDKENYTNKLIHK
jgi:hypothetical protein